jgi:hypothetical protein
MLEVVADAVTGSPILDHWVLRIDGEVSLVRFYRGHWEVDRGRASVKSQKCLAVEIATISPLFVLGWRECRAHGWSP